MKAILFLMLLLCLSSVTAVVDDLRAFTNSTGGQIIFPDSEGVEGADRRVGRFMAKYNLTISYFEIADNNYGAGENQPATQAQFSGCRLKNYETGAIIAEGTRVGFNRCAFTNTVFLNASVSYAAFVDKLAVSRWMSANTSWPSAGTRQFTNITRNGTNIIFNNTGAYDAIGGLPGSEFNTLMTVSTEIYPPVNVCTGSLNGDNHITYNLFREEDGITQQNNNFIDLETYINVSTNLSNSIFSTRIANTTNFTICSTGNHTYDFHFTYNQESPGYSNRYYDNKVSFQVGGNNLSRSMFNLNATSVTSYSNLVITLRNDNNFDYFTDVYARLDRKYASTGQWRTVQMSRSDELGLLTFLVKEQDTEYRIYYYDSFNNLILFTSPLKFIECSTGTCSLTYLLNPDYLSGNDQPSFRFTSSYNNNTGVIFVNWTESTGLSDYVLVNFTRESSGGSVKICSNQTNVSVGKVGCFVGSTTGTIRVNARAHINSSDAVISQYSAFYQVLGVKLHNLVGKYESGLWTFGIVLTASMFGLASPVIAVMCVIIGLIFVFALGIASPVNITFLIISTAMAAFIGMKLKD